MGVATKTPHNNENAEHVAKKKKNVKLDQLYQLYHTIKQINESVIHYLRTYIFACLSVCLCVYEDTYADRGHL